MTNLCLYILTTTVYLGAWCAWSEYTRKKFSARLMLKMVAWVLVLCLPLNINGNIFTVLGNAVSEKSVYSICSLYQKAEQNAFSIIGIGGVQKANKGEALICLGITLSQEAGKEAATCLGITLCQEAGQGAVTAVGIVGFQKAKNCSVLIGLAGYQTAELFTMVVCGLAGYQDSGMDADTFCGLVLCQKSKNDALVLLGLAGYQQAGEDATVMAGLSGYQNSGQSAGVGVGLVGFQQAKTDCYVHIGLAGFQKADVETKINLGMTLYQEVVGYKTRTFGVWSWLTAK